MYNYTSFGNVTNILELTQVVNTHFMFDLLGLLILLALGMVLVSSFYYSTRDAKNSILATSFILLVLGFFMMAIDLLTGLQLFALLAGCAAAAAFTWQR